MVSLVLLLPEEVTEDWFKVDAFRCPQGGECAVSFVVRQESGVWLVC